MRRSALALALLLSSLGSILADAPKAVLRGPSTVSVDSTIVLDARGSTADRPLKWKLDGPEGSVLLALDQDGRKGVVALVPSAPAGIYRFTLVARGIPPGDVEMDADAAVWTVEVGDPPDDRPKPKPTPTPVPPPPPNPAPTPTPVAGTLHVSLVIDTNAMSYVVAQLREGEAIRPALKEMDAVYRTYSSASTELARLNLAKNLAPIGTPALIVQDSSGRVVAAEKAPTDEAGVIERVRSIRGAK